MRLPAALGAFCLTAAIATQPAAAANAPPPPAAPVPGALLAHKALYTLTLDHGERQRCYRRPRHHGLRGHRCLRRLGRSPAAAHDHHQFGGPGHRDGLGLRDLGIQGRPEVPLPHAPDHRHRGHQPDRRRRILQKPGSTGRRTTRRRTTPPARCLPARCSRWRTPPRSSPRRATRSISCRCRCSTAPMRPASRTALSSCWTGSRRCRASGRRWSPLPSTRVNIAFFDHTQSAVTPTYEVAMRTGRTASRTT